MRGLLASGLCLVLGMAAVAHAEDGRWQPATPRQEPPAVGPRRVSLLRPVPLEAAPAAAPVTPVSFSTDDQPRPLVRAKVYEPAQPMPVGPTIVGTGSPVPPAAPAAPAPDKSSAGGSDVWGTVVSRWGDGVSLSDGAFPVVGDGVGHPVGDGGGHPVGDAGGPCGDCCSPDGCPCGPCGDCCPCSPGLFRGLLGGMFGGSCCCQDSCCLPRVWGSAEYLMWWIKDAHTPPLVAVSPAGTPQALAGVLGSSTVVAGGDLSYDMFSGGRFTVGGALPWGSGLGVEATYFFLSPQGFNAGFGGTGVPPIGRPVIDAATGAPVAELVAFPGLVIGSVNVHTQSRLWGAELNARQRLWCGCNGHLDLIGGFRFLELDESLSVTENLMVLPDQFLGGLARSNSFLLPAGSGIVVFDSFRTKNDFYGGQLGLDGEYRFGNLILGGQFKLAMGDMHEQVIVNGSTTFLPVGGLPVVQQGGLLALPSNIGTQSRNRFAVIPELGVKVGYQLTDHIRITAGYNFLYASSVVRPGDQIDPVINRAQLPLVVGPGAQAGIAPPRRLFQPTDFYAHGVTLGLEIKY